MGNIVSEEYKGSKVTSFDTYLLHSKMISTRKGRIFEGMVVKFEGAWVCKLGVSIYSSTILNVSKKSL